MNEIERAIAQNMRTLRHEINALQSDLSVAGYQQLVGSLPAEVQTNLALVPDVDNLPIQETPAQPLPEHVRVTLETVMEIGTIYEDLEKDPVHALEEMEAQYDHIIQMMREAGMNTTKFVEAVHFEELHGLLQMSHQLQQIREQIVNMRSAEELERDVVNAEHVIQDPALAQHVQELLKGITVFENEKTYMNKILARAVAIQQDWKTGNPLKEAGDLYRALRRDIPASLREHFKDEEAAMYLEKHVTPENFRPIPTGDKLVLPVNALVEWLENPATYTQRLQHVQQMIIQVIDERIEAGKKLLRVRTATMRKMLEVFLEKVQRRNVVLFRRLSQKAVEEDMLKQFITLLAKRANLTLQIYETLYSNRDVTKGMARIRELTDLYLTETKKSGELLREIARTEKKAAA
ncbi:TPA: hypothetical protein HA278_00460 [Candidatus Woesearchaeota archaeon]|nr:hypothetical protein [archaeon]HIJ10501.1 hypothetical protein [Candidatus Woesearchaeota archaeon]